MRKCTKEIKIGNVIIGGNHPIAIQSMTNTITKNVDATIKQINELANIGCEIVRVAVLDEDDAIAIKSIKEHVSVPIVADIHYDYRLAILAIKAGADKIRINPGNIGSADRIEAIITECKNYHIPIRIGVNSGSLEKDILIKYQGATADALVESMERSIKLIESFSFFDIVLSIKATDIETTLSANRILATKYNYPIHLGLTEAGTVSSGTIRSSYVLGTLLNEGIGDTIRVSLHGNPCHEIPVCKEILSMCHLYQKPTLIVCPTCGRTMYNMTPIVDEIDKYLSTIHSSIKVAIMGCVVNGPGEASSADIGIAGGNHCAVLFKKGKIIEKIDEANIVKRLIEEIDKMEGEKND